jgi:microcystin-dependent protein
MACYESFIGDISISPYTFAPYNFAFCNGSMINISQNTALFSLLGTNFGGNGVTVFQLPDLCGRIPLGADGKTFHLGDTGGVATVTPEVVMAEKPDADEKTPTIQVAGPGTIQTLPPFLALNYIIALRGVFPRHW